MAEPDRPDPVLAGIDGPRPLPPDLRERLADRLLGPGAGSARPLDRSLDRRLDRSLGDRPLVGAARSPAGASGVGARWPRRTRWAAGAVAAGLLIAGGVGVALDHPGRSRPAASASSAGASGSGPMRASGGHQPAAGQRDAGPASAPTAGPAARSSAVPASGPGVNSAAGLAAQPLVSGLAPSHGPAAGGTWVTLTGTGLDDTLSVRFGATAGPRLVVVSGTTVRVLAPAHPPGPVSVTATTRAGQARATIPFTYTGS